MAGSPKGERSALTMRGCSVCMDCLGVPLMMAMLAFRGLPNSASRITLPAARGLRSSPHARRYLDRMRPAPRDALINATQAA
ncbi:hypothetical protein GCM10027066_34190 [Dyella jejuensis]